LALLVQRSGLDAVAPTDYDRFENAFDLAMLAIGGSALFWLAILSLAGWIVVTAGFFQLSRRVQQAVSPFTKNGPGQLKRLAFMFLFIGAASAGIAVLWWLRSEKLIPSGFYAAGMDLFSVIMAIACFVYAVFKIRQALKLLSQEKDD
jgi:uncharacterized membrane protein